MNIQEIDGRFYICKGKEFLGNFDTRKLAEDNLKIFEEREKND